jgi:hypothetical protein
MADPGVHDADPGVHERRSWRSRSPDPAVHDAPIRVFTIVRNPHRGSLRIRNATLYERLAALTAAGSVVRSRAGYRLART